MYLRKSVRKKDGKVHTYRRLVRSVRRNGQIVLPKAEVSPRELRIRCVVRPDKARAQLLDRPGLRLPRRLEIPAC